MTPTGRRLAGTLAAGAALIAVVTALARVMGFLRGLLLARAVGGTTCLATAYSTANMLPNVLFEVAAGGALAGAVVPTLAAALDRGDLARARRLSAALLGWSLLVLVPVALLGAVVARPAVSLLLDTGAAGTAARRCAGINTTATGMLLVFLPQVVLYGLAVVSAAALQAGRRFLAAALAPLVSSLVVAATYLAFAVMFTGDPGDLRTLSGAPELVLTWGTTAGVLALALTTLVPMARAGLLARPTLRFPDNTGRPVRALAGAGLAGLLAQQVSVVVVLLLTNGHGTGILAYTSAWSVFLLPYAVLAVPIATAAFPALSAHAAAGRETAFAETTARAARAVLLAAGAGAALLVGTAVPVSRVFLAGTPGQYGPLQLAWALAAFAPGLLGYGLMAHLSRALYARHEGRAAAVATAAGWGTVIVADVALVAALPASAVLTALGLGNSLGMTVAATLLAVALRGSAGRSALSGLVRAGTAAVAGGVAGGLIGVLATRALDALAAPGAGAGWLASVPVAVVAALAALAGWLLVAAALDRADARQALAMLRAAAARATGGRDGRS